MKRSLLLLLNSLVLGGVLALGVSGSCADELKFADLEKKISIDKSPVSPEGGAVTTYAPALKKVMPAVVTIFSSKSVTTTRNPQQEELFRRMFPDLPDDFFEKQENGEGGREHKEQGLGSGVVISPDGYILTNNHVVGDADEIKVTLSSNKREYPATLIGADPQTDVALIKIEAKDLPFVTIGDSSTLQVGDVALAVGNPLGLEQTATLGIISAVGRSDVNILENGYESFIQTDAAINRGNSGGALVDAAGRLIGIPTAIQSNFSGGNIGIGFAIPSNMALNIVQRLLDGGGVVKRGFLGVYLRELDPNMAKALGREDRSGVLVAEVGEKTPAEAAGMKAGDLIVGYEGKPVESMQQLRLDISNTAPETEVLFSLVRKGEKTDLKVTLGDLDDNKLAGGSSPRRPGAAKEKELVEGVSVTNLDEEARSSLQLDDSVEGVLVKSVKDNALAAEAGLRPGMVITQIDQTDVKSVDEAYKIVENFESDVLLLQVYVAGRRDILAVPLVE
ncbi:MAG: Do family serine endopeptidase [Verrucomicrobiaceae bacterium]|nr:Do family serine endopeptidase [Verrucomicrobiaceae bacterium]